MTVLKFIGFFYYHYPGDYGFSLACGGLLRCRSVSRQIFGRSSAHSRLRTCYTHEWRKTKKSIEPRKTMWETKKFSGSYTEVNPEVRGYQWQRGHYKDYKDLTETRNRAREVSGTYSLDIIDFSSIARGVSQMSLFHDLVTECTTGVFEASPIGDWGMNSFLGMTIITPF